MAMRKPTVCHGAIGKPSCDAPVGVLAACKTNTDMQVTEAVCKPSDGKQCDELAACKSSSDGTKMGTLLAACKTNKEWLVNTITVDTRLKGGGVCGYVEETEAFDTSCKGHMLMGENRFFQ